MEERKDGTVFRERDLLENQQREKSLEALHCKSRHREMSFFILIRMKSKMGECELGIKEAVSALAGTLVTR